MDSQSLYQDIPPAAPVEKATVVEDFVDVFYAPSKVFERRREGQFGIALLLLVILVAVLFFATRAVMEPVYDATMEQSIQAQLRANPNMPPEAVAAMRSFGGIGIAVSAVLGAPLFVLGTGLLVFFVARLFDLKPTFTQAATIATFANVPRFLLGTLAVAAQAFLLPASDTPRGMFQLAVGPARFADPDASTRLLGFLMRFELFTLWATVLIGIGVATVCRTSRKNGMLVAALVWFVATLTGVAFAR